MKKEFKLLFMLFLVALITGCAGSLSVNPKGDQGQDPRPLWGSDYDSPAWQEQYGMP
jgi:hypothetical protein